MRYQTFPYHPERPFVLYDVPGKMDRDSRDSLLPHWHDELEIAWIF
ncbi:MAG: hypothetical protein ACI4OJ_12320 [Lachnospiraceae bacterium]